MALISRIRWIYLLAQLLAGTGLFGLVLEFRHSWAALPGSEGQLGLYGSMGIALAAVLGYCFKAMAETGKFAPERETSLKARRVTEKATLQRDLAVDRANALQAKVTTLEAALQKSLQRHVPARNDGSDS